MMAIKAASACLIGEYRSGPRIIYGQAGRRIIMVR